MTVTQYLFPEIVLNFPSPLITLDDWNWPAIAIYAFVPGVVVLFFFYVDFMRIRWQKRLDKNKKEGKP